MSLRRKLNRLKKHIVIEEERKGAAEGQMVDSQSTSTDRQLQESGSTAAMEQKSQTAAALEQVQKSHTNVDEARARVQESRATGNEPQQAASTEEGTALTHWDKWATAEVRRETFQGQPCLVRERVYARDARWGRYAFGDLAAIVAKWHDYGYTHPLSTQGAQCEDLLFFDTETTGLSGGAGNTVFLLGTAQLLPDGVRVKQYFLPEPQAEAALYYYFLIDMHEDQRLVTYNGKAFDWPQVKTRHTFVRDVSPSLPSLPHYDLLHAARRLWKHQLPSLRLSIVEREKLGIVRRDDTPGSLAPLLYFDYLRHNDPTDILTVFRHNEADVLSLISLYTHVSTLLLGLADESLAAEEHYEVGRWYEAVGEHERALTSYRYACRRAVQTEKAVTYRAKKAAANLYKKKGQWTEAVALWQDCCQNGPKLDDEPYIELAKAYEHQYKQFDEALYYAEKAYEIWRESGRLLRGGERRREQERKAFKKRIARLESKCSQPSLF
ncbi:ribonuclease H-like domain-containing protein [Numidum massiliense]|uniref:ribonuclease H-like domain-containing protein n=1 Tax=Numidum massiliense TaxID=1522315 RepID=UPI0006D54664|nr:ribonuclease H-like domain-containing protein [Numidum massiliense]